MLLAIAIAAFVSLGLPDSVLGVAWPSIRRTFDLPLSQLGSLLAAAMTGYLLSTFSSGWVVARLGVGRVLLWSTLLMVANSGAYALAPAWWVMVASGVLAGLGAGAIEAGINAFAAAHFSPRLVTWLHASYGIGAMLGPLLMTAILTSWLGWRWGYAVIGAVLAAMAVSFFLTLGPWQMPSAGGERLRPHAASMGLVATLGQPRVWVNISIFFVYTGLEVTAGQWTYSLFTVGRGFSPALVGTWIGCYWASLTAGRVISGAVVSRVSASALLRLATLGAPLAALLLWSGAGPVSSFMGGGAETAVPLPEVAQHILTSYITAVCANAKASDPLFVSRFKAKGGHVVEVRMKGRRVWKITKAIGERAGVPEIHPHAFRHSSGVQVLRLSGGNLRAVQEHLRNAERPNAQHP